MHVLIMIVEGGGQKQSVTVGTAVSHAARADFMPASGIGHYGCNVSTKGTRHRLHLTKR